MDHAPRRRHEPSRSPRLGTPATRPAHDRTHTLTGVVRQSAPNPAFDEQGPTGGTIGHLSEPPQNRRRSADGVRSSPSQYIRSEHAQFLRRLGQGRSSTSGTRCPLPPCGSSSGSLDPRESGQHRRPPTAADHRVSPATAALAASHLRPPGASIPPWCACLRPSMSSGAFRLLTAASTDGSSASGHMPLSAGGSKS